MFAAAVGRWLGKERPRGLDEERLWQAQTKVEIDRMISEQFIIGVAAANFSTKRG
jgi:hypothetical protein